ncbi:MAG: hypothetical protein K2J99_16415 [Lachnospiraceae bacterium]|nr:hypothetical protein [Lachnospiraceae bacterium]
MTIGALGAYGFQPYVYNMNTVSSASMNKLSKISDDVLDKKIDYSELADESKNVNPLKKGQTLDFQELLQMQMQRGQNNAARIMKPSEQTKEAEEDTAQVSEAAVAQFDQAVAQTAEVAASEDAAEMTGANSGNSNINYQMQQAINAYEMFMTA